MWKDKKLRVSLLTGIIVLACPAPRSRSSLHRTFAVHVSKQLNYLPAVVFWMFPGSVDCCFSWLTQALNCDQTRGTARRRCLYVRDVVVESATCYLQLLRCSCLVFVTSPLFLLATWRLPRLHYHSALLVTCPPTPHVCCCCNCFFKFSSFLIGDIMRAHVSLGSFEMSSSTNRVDLAAVAGFSSSLFSRRLHRENPFLTKCMRLRRVFFTWNVLCFCKRTRNGT